MTPRFDTDTSVVRDADGAYSARIDPGWWIERGPNGGYIAAILVRALAAHDAETAGGGTASGDRDRGPGRHPRSLTVHYLAPAREGPAEISVRTERAGRTVHYLSASLRQGDRLLATAHAAFAVLNTDAPSFSDHTFPQYPDPDTMDTPAGPPIGVPMRERYEYRVVVGNPWEGPGSQAETGGWIRLRDPRPYDPTLVVAVSDAWHPAIFARLQERMGVPTVDLTVHIRSVAALQLLKPDDWLAVRFRTTVATEGFLEEDGEIWGPDGTLIAHSRQLALILAP
ncbi:MAG TPA: thioesterase family protein [Acidimicrobiales bacterium]|nr:thioesterase family protein [Acidimicrobiales bacterium]